MKHYRYTSTKINTMFYANMLKISITVPTYYDTV